MESSNSEEGFSRVLQVEETVQDKLIENLSHLDSERLKELKSQSPSGERIYRVVTGPFPFPATQDTNLQSIMVNHRRCRSATTRMAEVSDVMFQLPEDFEISDETVNKLIPKEEKIRRYVEHMIKQYSFFERLRGWRIERRQRVSRHLDTYYNHERSKTKARSTRDVVNFIIYEYPPKLKGVDKHEFMDGLRCKSERSCLSSQSGNGNVILDKETYVREALRIVWSNLVNSTNEESPVFKEKGRNEVNMSNVISSPPQNDNEALENEQSSVEPQRRVERHWIDLNKISDMSSSDDTLD